MKDRYLGIKIKNLTQVKGTQNSPADGIFLAVRDTRFARLARFLAGPQYRDYYRVNLPSGNAVTILRGSTAYEVRQGKVISRVDLPSFPGLRLRPHPRFSRYP